MAEKLIQHLRKKSEEHLHLKLLQSQWNFDQELIPKALQNVAAIFPHYSRHDISHSRQILINIERLLGDTLTSLTATDTWLLLEAAYWHDIGMIVTAKDIADDIQSFQFKQYVNDIASQSGHELHEFAKKFSSLNPQDCFSAAETPHEAVELYRQLLAGWYRGRHSNRAANIIDDPWEKTGIASPRNELVPHRLFRLLGQICRLHGADSNSILESLPYREAGMATEDCHPRFVTCLLRLGDLLDLDDNRFCPVMLRVAGDIPPSSQAHIEKHNAIRHLRIDPERIEIIAECPNYESYEATDQWFRWIEDELRFQVTHWEEIVPNREFVLLPNLGKLEVKLENYELLNSGQRPRFDVDSQKIIELLQGTGMYRDRWQSLRELLQNSVDATLMRIWLTRAENPDTKDKNIDWKNPLSPEIKEIFNDYPIEVSLSKIDGAKPDHTRWELAIKDRGIGISKQDLSYMTSVGASSKNSARKEIITRMPVWMRPSGAFGIGLQSAFMISQQIVFDTKSLLSDDKLKIKMKSPIPPEKGYVYVQQSRQPYGRDYGSLLSLEFESKAIPETVSLPFGNPTFTRNILADFDPILMQEIPYEASKMVDEVANFSVFSPIPIQLTFCGQPITIIKAEIKGETSKHKPYYSPKTGVMLHDVKFDTMERYDARVAFRGQHIEKYHSRLAFVYFQADILTDIASDTLTINRNDIKETAQNHVYGLLFDTIEDYLTSGDCHLSSEEEKYAASAFLFNYGKAHLCPDIQDKWLNIKLKMMDCSIKELCSKDNFCIYVRSEFGLDTHPENCSLTASSTRSPSFSLLLHHWNKQKGYLQKETENEGGGGQLFNFSKESLPPFGNEYFKKLLLIHLNTVVGGRYSMPSWGDYDRLSADTSDLAFCYSLSDCHKNYNQFILPFFFSKKQKKVTEQGLDELCQWTLKHSKYRESGITAQEIRELYKKLIDWVDKDLMGDSEEWKKLRKT